MKPSQLNAKGLTHVVWAWARLDETGSFVFEYGHEDVVPDFLALKTSSTQVWIDIKPDDPAENGGTSVWYAGSSITKTCSLTRFPYRNKLLATPSGRARFISSLKDFMAKWGFQGVQIEDAYLSKPTFPSLVSLVKEMRDSYGTQYGISVALPQIAQDIEYFNPKLMEPYVDFFDFFALLG